MRSASEKSDWRFAPWLILEVVGALLLIANGLPIYRKMLYSPNEQIQHFGALFWALAATVMIQVGYWVRYYGKTPILHLDNALVGHLVLFISRLSFLFATSAFGYIFISGSVDLQVSWMRYATSSSGRGRNTIPVVSGMRSRTPPPCSTCSPPSRAIGRG